jgi:hypothetical protein
MADMFGAPVGMSAAIGDLSQLATIDYNKAMTAEAQARMAETVTRTEAAKQKIQDDAAARKIMAESRLRAAPGAASSAPGMPGVAPATPIGGVTAFDQASSFLDNQMYTISQLANGGYFQAANELFHKTTQDISHLSAAGKNMVDSQGKLLKNAQDSASYANQLTLGIKDQGSLDRAKLQFLADNPNMPLPGWMNLPWNQAAPYVKQIQESSKEGMEAAKLKSEIDKNKATAAEQSALSRLNKLKADLEEMEVKAQRERQDRAVKAGEPIPSIHDKAKGVLSANERMNAQMMTGAGNTLAIGLEEILKLPIGTGKGTFADLAYSDEPSFLGGAKKFLANTLTKDQQQFYATRLVGSNVAAATLANQGRAPRVSQMNAEEAALATLSGQSGLVAIDKVNQAALKALNELQATRTGGDLELENNLALTRRRFEHLVEVTTAIKEKLQNAKQPGRRDKSSRAAETRLPSDIPKGSKLVGLSEDNKPVYQSPDGKQWVSEEK